MQGGQSWNSHPGLPVPRAQVYTASLEWGASRRGLEEIVCTGGWGQPGWGPPPRGAAASDQARKEEQQVLGTC